MAWTDPKTWVVDEFVDAAEANAHWRDNMKILRALTIGVSALTAREGSPVLDGANHLLNSSEANNAEGGVFDWAALALAGGTAQWRAVSGFNIDALNGTTGGSFTSLAWREVASTGVTPLYLPFHTIGVPNTLGGHVFDSGWSAIPASELATNWGIYYPAYALNFTGGPPTVTGLNVAILLRII